MKKLRSVFALLVVLALSCGAAFAAPSAADLASAGIEEKMWGAFGVRDLKGLGEASDSVIATLLKGQVPEEMLQKMIATMKNADIRIGLTEEYEPKGFSFAAQTAGEFNLADYGSLKAPEFAAIINAATQSETAFPKRKHPPDAYTRKGALWRLSAFAFCAPPYPKTARK